MPTNFPTALDAFPSAVALAANTLNTNPHSALHGNLGDALAALEAKVGVDGSSVPSSLDFLLSLKAALASPTFTGTPSAPTAALGTNTTQLATTAFVLANAPALPPDVARTGVANTFTVGPQTIRTGADGARGLVVKGNSASQSANLQEWQSSASNAGVLVGFWNAAAKPGVQVYNDAGNLVFGAPHNGNDEYVFLRNLTMPAGSAISGVGSLIVESLQSGQGIFTVSSGNNSIPLVIGNNSTSVTQEAIILRLRSSTASNRLVGQILWQWADSTDAARKGRLVLGADDSTTANGSPREGLRIEADGSNPLIGFLGASAVSRPTVTGSRGGNVALASLLTALASLGLITDSTT